MEKYSFICSVVMGNISVLETEEQKKAMSGFLKSFNVKPSIQKVKTSSAKYDYYYEAKILFEDLSFLKVLRFSEALRAFCLFWGMSYHEHSLNELPDIDRTSSVS